MLLDVTRYSYVNYTSIAFDWMQEDLIDEFQLEK